MRDTTSGRVRLRRTWNARLFGSWSQLALTLYAAAFLALLGLQGASGSLSGRYWYFYLVDAVVAVLWLRGITAWAEADEHGVRWRYWTKTDLPWRRVERVALGERAVLASPQPLPRTREPAILVRTKSHDTEIIWPARGMSRRRREFGTALLALARAHGVATAVTGGRWNEPVTSPEQPFA